MVGKELASADDVRPRHRPVNGAGVNLIWNTATNTPAIDQNFDGVADAITTGQPNLMQLNLSPGAQGVLLPATSLPLDLNNFGTTGTRYPDPDTNITYPDFNNPFLAVDTLVPNGTENPVRVITPSFHRPFLCGTPRPMAAGRSRPTPGILTRTRRLWSCSPTRSTWQSTAGKLPATAVQRFVTNKHRMGPGSE